MLQIFLLLLCLLAGTAVMIFTLWQLDIRRRDRHQQAYLRGPLRRHLKYMISKARRRMPKAPAVEEKEIIAKPMAPIALLTFEPPASSQSQLPGQRNGV